MQTLKEQETTTYFRFATALANARRSGDAVAIDEAMSDLETFLLYADNPKLAMRAEQVLLAA